MERQLLGREERVVLGWGTDKERSREPCVDWPRLSLVKNGSELIGSPKLKP
jgi:hypothetical protein